MLTLVCHAKNDDVNSVHMWEFSMVITWEFSMVITCMHKFSQLFCDNQPENWCVATALKYLITTVRGPFFFDGGGGGGSL